jgi:MFS transporter, PHS family, inorganic phosphate transporter
MGPNCTTFLIPVEVFPTRVRGSAHGIAAASGKAGAVVTAFSFAQLTDAIGLPAVLGILSGVMALCALCTLLIPETKGRTLDEIEQGVMYGVKAPDSVASSGDVSPVLEGRTSVHPKSQGKKGEVV